MSPLEELGRQAIFLFFFALAFLVVIFFFLFWFGWFVTRTRGSVSPYSKQPMMFGTDMPLSIARQIEEHMKTLPQPDNPPFDISQTAICRETGRIFQNAVGKTGVIVIHPNFLQDRLRGNWVSWGSLSDIQKGIVRLHHMSIEGFQTEQSCPKPRPEDIESYYAFSKPGPLYVDVITKTLLGWQLVPGTNFEVLVVKRPDYESIDQTI
jgi:hypothetical protein